MVKVCICSKRESGNYILSRLRAGYLGITIAIAIVVTMSLLRNKDYISLPVLIVLLIVAVVAITKKIQHHSFVCSIRRGWLSLINAVTSPF